MPRYQITSRLCGQSDLEEMLSTAWNTGRTQVTLYDSNDKPVITFSSFNYGRHYHGVQQALLEGVWKIECACPGHTASEEGRKPEKVDSAKVRQNVAAWATTGTPFLG